MATRLMLALACAALSLLPAGRSAAGPFGGESQCVPAGLPPFRTWELRAATSLEILDENDRTQPGLVALFKSGGQLINTIWVGNLLVSVDPTPDDPNAPGWHDRGAVLNDTTLRAVRRQACDWFQPLPPEEKRS